MISLKIEGEKRLVAAFDKVQDRGRRHDLMDRIGAAMVSSTQQRFLDKTDPDGQSWKPSARAREAGGQTMRDTGRLFQSMTHRAGTDQTEWGTNVIYAAIHQFGGVIRPKSAKALQFQGINGFVTVKKVTMPIRAFLGVNTEDRKEIGAVVTDWMQEAFA